MSPPRPRVRLHVGQSVDGKLAAPGQGAKSMGGPVDRRAIARVRAWADAIVVGAGTVRAANVPMHLGDVAAVARRKSRGQAAQPLPVVLCGSGRLPADARALGGRRAMVAVGHNNHVNVGDALRAQTQIWPSACSCRGAVHNVTHGVCLPALLTKLHKAGVRRLLVEGGGVTAWSFVAARLLDEVFCTVAPCLIGGAAAPTPVDGAGLDFAERLPLQLRRAYVRDGCVMLRYRVGDTAQAPALAQSSPP